MRRGLEFRAVYGVIVEIYGKCVILFNLFTMRTMGWRSLVAT